MNYLNHLPKAPHTGLAPYSGLAPYTEPVPLAALAANFEPIDLTEMQAVALQDRQETKYVFTTTLLCQLLAEAPTHYRLLSIQEQRLARYRTLYFDTPELDFYHRHLAGAPIRTKVRAREYIDTHTTYLEVKQRTNRKRTVKHRLPTDTLVTSLDNEHADFIASELPALYTALEPILWNRYSRLTLVGTTTLERVTIDLDLAFQGAQHIGSQHCASLRGIVIAEVKQPRINRFSPIVEMLRAAKVRPASFSKYCMGVSTLLPGIPRHKINKTHRLVQRLLS